MFYNKTIKIAFLISLTGHLLILGIPVNLFILNPKNLEYITVHIERPKILPQIEKMGDKKILGKSKSELAGTRNEQGIGHLEKIESTDLTEEAMLRYQDMIKQRIEEVRWYPEQAKERKYEGAVHIRFTVSPTGQLGPIQILHSSGYEILDQAAVETVKRASPFPSIPAEINQSSVYIEASIVYLSKVH